MAAESNFIFGDDFDAIMAILEENEELENDFYEAVKEVSIKILRIYRVFGLHKVVDMNSQISYQTYL